MNKIKRNKIIFTSVILVCVIIMIVGHILMVNKRVDWNKPRHEEMNLDQVMITDITDGEKELLKDLCKNNGNKSKVDYIIANENIDLSQYGYDKPGGDTVLVVVQNGNLSSITVQGRISEKDRKYIVNNVNSSVNFGSNLYSVIQQSLYSIDASLHEIDAKNYISKETFTVWLIIFSLITIVGALESLIKLKKSLKE